MIENKSEFNWRLFWNSRKEFVLAVLLAVLSLMVVVIGVLQQIGPLTNAYAKMKNREAEMNKFMSKANALTELASDPSMNSFSEVDKVLPSHKPILEILTNLNNVANTTQVAIRNFTIAPGAIATDSTQVRRVSRNSYDFLDLTFSVNGPLWRVQNFMTLIEQTTPLGTITSISINRQIDEDKNAEAQANLILRTFYFTQSISTTIATPLPEVAGADQDILRRINELVPTNLETQTEVIRGDRGNLFGLQGLSIEELQQQLEESVTAQEEGAEGQGQTEENSSSTSTPPASISTETSGPAAAPGEN